MKTLRTYLVVAGASLALIGCEGGIGPAGPAGEAGAVGAPGAAGDGCTATDNNDGTYTVNCGGSDVIVSDGGPGAPGAGCSVTANGDGTYDVDCGGDVVTVSDGSGGVDANVELFGLALENLVVSDIVVTNVAGAVHVTFHVEDADTGEWFTDFQEFDDNIRAYVASHVPAGTTTATTFTDTTSPTLTFDTAYLERWAYQRNRDRTTDFALDISDAIQGNYGFTLVDTGTFTALEAGTTEAVDYVAGDTQRLFLRVDGRGFGYNRTIGMLDFVVPAAGASTTGLSALERVIVDRTACQACHNNPLERAAHGGGYQDPNACNVCHTPIGGAYGDQMQNHDTWSAKLFHQLHSAIPNAAHPDRIDGTGYAAVKFPGDVGNCATCHFDVGQDLADNWKTNPTIEVCSTCHTTVVFDGATQYTQLNGDLDTHFAQTNNSGCTGCHTATGTGANCGVTDDHTCMDIVAAHAPEVRTMSATITGVEVEAGTGNVIVTFTVDNGGTAVTDTADFSNGLAFSLVQLAKGTGGASDHWVSYTARARTKDALQEPVIQGYSELATDGTLATPSSGVFTYTFALVNANTDGDITSDMNDVVNVSTVGAYPATYANVVVYDASLTHRVGMEFREVDGTRNLTNATFDFVPDGTTAINTRAIVTMDTCNNCHGGARLHKGYAVEYCVTCHNQSTFDPFSGDAPMTVDLQTMVHKLHMGYALPSVVGPDGEYEDDPDTTDVDESADNGTYVINGSHDYSNLVIPQSPSNCLICHDESNADGANWKDKPTRRACGACHDSMASQAHLAANTFDPTPNDLYSGDEAESCAVCHGAGKLVPVDDAHYGVSQ